MTEYPSRPLGELTVNHDRKRIPVRSSDRRPGPYPYFGASGVVDHVDDYLFEGLHLLVAEDGENLRSRKTPVAFLADGQFWVNNHAHVLQANADNDVRFLSYALESANISGHITGSAQPKLSQAALSSIAVVAPPFDVQRAIAATLGALDDKIESNRRVIKLSRDLAISILTAAAVTAHVVGTVAAVRKGLSYQGAGLTNEGLGAPMVNMGSAANFGWLKRDGFKYYNGPFRSRHVAKPQSLIITSVEQTWKHEIIGWPLLVPDDMGDVLFTHHMLLVDFAEEDEWMRLPLWAWLYTAESRAILEGAVYGTTVATISPSAVETMQFKAPSKDSRAIPVASALLKQAWSAERESASLTALRDALLPELLSGRLRAADGA